MGQGILPVSRNFLLLSLAVGVRVSPRYRQEYQQFHTCHLVAVRQEGQVAVI